MTFSQSTYHSKVYRDFREIEVTNYRKVIHFYEEKETEIRKLDFEESFELLVAYVNALFEIGAYQKHLLMVDYVIESSILGNIQYYQGEDIYCKMLFKKSASHYNLFEFEKADYILRELVKMNPYNEDNILFLKKCLRRKNTNIINQARAGGILLFLLSAIVISFEVLLIRPFYKNFVDVIEISRIVLFLLGVVFLLGGDFIHRWKIEREVNQFVQSLISDKKNNI